MPSKPLLLTLGDPCGIGPEITVKAWESLRTHKQYTFAIIAPPSVISQAGGVVTPIENLTQARKYFASSIPILPIDGIPVKAGEPNSHHATAITQSIEIAVEKTISGDADAVITNPIAKDILYDAGFKYPGHTEYLGELTKTYPAPYERGPVMMLTGGGLRVGLTTIHIPLAKVKEQLSTDNIVRTARIIHSALQCDFGIENPRISIAGLNPHAGEGGALGDEEIKIINPAAKILRESGIQASDAQSADTLFHAQARQGYDAVLAMYHDQGLIPVKTLDFHGGVNITLGLPIVRTSPDHGTAFNIAGQNKARPDSLITAIKLAREIADNRRHFKSRADVS